MNRSERSPSSVKEVADAPRCQHVQDPPGFSISTTLGVDGWRAHEAGTIREGERRASADARIDCILVDVNLPDGDGIDLVAALRTRPHLANTPIIVLTGTADRATKARAFIAGADGYIVKPVPGPLLIARVRGATRQRSHRG